MCQSILRRNRFSTLRSRVNIDIYATRVNLCTDKNSIIKTDDESMINYTEVIMSQHKNTAHIHREPDLTHTAAVTDFNSLFFCYEGAVCVCDVGERPRPSGGSFPRDRA